MSMIKGIRFRATGPGVPSVGVVDLDVSSQRLSIATSLEHARGPRQPLGNRVVGGSHSYRSRPLVFSEIRAIGDAGGSVFPNPISRDRPRSEIKTCPATLDQESTTWSRWQMLDGICPGQIDLSRIADNNKW